MLIYVKIVGRDPADIVTALPASCYSGRQMAENSKSITEPLLVIYRAGWFLDNIILS